VKNWFLTGASRGLGRVWTEAALGRGDRVVATARRAQDLDELQSIYPDALRVLTLDVNDRSAVFAALPQAQEFLGTVDVVVNNAGFGLFGMVEEITEQQARDQFETNVFGALWVTQAALPIMREQRSGHILQVSSIGGVQAFPGLGIYNASKWALEGFSQALAQEVADFGISVTLIEPTGYGTDWAFGSAMRADPVAAYDDYRERAAAARARVAGDRGDPAATAPVVLQLVDMEDPPLRLFLGDGPYEVIQAEYASRLAEWDAYADLSRSAHRLPS
jgi:NAD(P)-dependent dehydrogenase (short-subunit alcohol dehydrogenase family)